MCFIPKPSKPATTPGNLRPLGIIRPDGEGLAGACRDHLRDIPQFAYQPHRGLSDALEKWPDTMARLPEELLQRSLYPRACASIPLAITRHALLSGSFGTPNGVFHGCWPPQPLPSTIGR